MGACQHGMVRPRVADGTDGLHIWWAAVNIFNKKLQKLKRGSAAWGLGEGLTTQGFYKIVSRASELDGHFGTT
jgi:hypothetical protein